MLALARAQEACGIPALLAVPLSCVFPCMALVVPAYGLGVV